MSKLIALIQNEIKSRGERLQEGHHVVDYGFVIKMLVRIQNVALEREAELNAYKSALDLIINHSSAEPIIKNHCQDILKQFN